MGEDEARRLAELDARIAAAHRAAQPAPRTAGKYAGAELAWRLMIDLLTGVGIGCGMGYGLDSLFGTLPVFLILLTLLGAVAGVRVMMRSAREWQARQARPAAEAPERNGTGR